MTHHYYSTHIRTYQRDKTLVGTVRELSVLGLGLCVKMMAPSVNVGAYVSKYTFKGSTNRLERGLPLMWLQCLLRRVDFLLWHYQNFAVFTRRTVVV